MKALVIAPQPFFSPRGTPLSVYYRTLVMSEMGAKVDLLTYGEGMDVDIPHVNIIRIPRFACLGDVKVGPSFLKLFLDGFMTLWTIGLLMRNRYDFVHAHEESIFFCVFLKPLFRFKLIYDMHSSLPQQLTNFKFTTSKTLIALFERLEDAAIQTSDVVITICPDLAEHVNRVIKNKNKHFLIENSLFDPIKFKTKPSGAGTENQGLDDLEGSAPVELPASKRFVVYAGTLESYQGIEILIKSFQEVVRRIPEAFLLIVGGTAEQVRHYSGLAADEGTSENILFTGRVSQRLAKHYCTLASVQLSPRSSGTNTPLKIYEQLASGIPLVATAIYSHTQVIDETVAILVQPDPASMASGIVEALQSPEKSRQIAASARNLYEEKYSRSVYERKMKQVLQVVGNRTTEQHELEQEVPH